VVPDARASGKINPEAAAAASVVVVTVPFAGQAATYGSIAESIRPDTVVIDCTVPLAAAVGGKPWQTVGVWQGSAAQQAGALVPSGAVCAAFHTLSAAALSALDTELEGDVLACGPKNAKRIVAELVEAIPRLRFVDAGPLDNARLVEPLTALLIGINRRYKVTGTGIRITGLRT
jgi:NADPH-dependent F420 reductase